VDKPADHTGEAGTRILKVAQSFTLLYRRLAVGNRTVRAEIRRASDGQQGETLRNSPADAGEPCATSERVSGRHWVALVGAMFGAFMAVLDIQITNASLNDILGSLGSTLDEGSWVSTSYLVAEIIVIPLTGWLSDVFAPRR
jgi:hypothetical protein